MQTLHLIIETQNHYDGGGCDYSSNNDYKDV